MFGSSAPDSSNAAGRPPEILWQPTTADFTNCRMARFREWLRVHRGLDFSDYAALWHWSTDDLAGFWSAIAEFFSVRFHRPPDTILKDPVMPGAQWFSGATLNYAEHAL